jgi:hypothetical protein
MPTAKLNIQHDYITLKVVYDPKTSINLTSSRNGIKVSGKGFEMSLMRNIMNAFDKFRKDLSVGERMNELLRVASEATSLMEFNRMIGGK